MASVILQPTPTSVSETIERIIRAAQPVRVLAALLLRKSADDAQALASADLEPLPDILGFHAQQAVEKLLKALLQEAGAS